MTRLTRHLLTACCAGVLGLLTLPAITQTKALMLNGHRVYEMNAFYEYNPDGVPVIGFIKDAKDEKRVTFITCKSVIKEVDRKLLKKTTANCTQGSGVSPFIALVKTSGSATNVALGTQQYDTATLPASSKIFIDMARAGEQVGFAFKDDDGKQAFAVFTKGD